MTLAEEFVTGNRRSSLGGANVLLIGINYFPEPTGIAPYTTGMANFLGDMADGVSVISGVPHYPSWRDDGGQRRRRTVEIIDGVRVTRLRHYVPRRQSALHRARYEASFLLNALTLRLHTRPDLVVGVTPSLGSAVAAARIAERFDSRLFILVQDLMARAATQTGISGGRAVSGLIARMERYALARADRVGVVSEAFRSPIEEYGVDAGAIDVVPNWTHITPVDMDPAQARALLGWPRHQRLVVHTGNMGLKQDLDNVVAAAALLAGQDDVHFLLVGDGSQRAHLERLTADLPNVTMVPSLDEETYPCALAAADLLVLNERPSVADMSLPSKLTSYLRVGKPVLAAVSPHGATARELARTDGAALLVEAGDPAQFAAAVRTLLAEPERLARMGAAGRAFATRELSQDHALDLLSAALARTLGDAVHVTSDLAHA